MDPVAHSRKSVSGRGLLPAKCDSYGIPSGIPYMNMNVWLDIQLDLPALSIEAADKLNGRPYGVWLGRNKVESGTSVVVYR